MIKLIEKEPSLEFIIPVLKWLKDFKLVSKKELEANYENALAAATDYTTLAAALAADAAYTSAAYSDNVENLANKYFTKISLTRKEVETELFKGEEVEYNKEFFADTKIRIESEEHSKYVQRLAFKAGYSWSSDSKDFRYKSADFLYFNGSLMLRGYNRGSFVKDISKEIFIPLPVEEAEPVNDVVQTSKLSTDYLSESKDVQLGRASQYGTEGKGERSFQAVAEAFNALTGEKLSGSDICLVQMCLKIVRQNSDKSRLHDDSLLDAVSYTSLWAEELNNEIL